MMKLLNLMKIQYNKIKLNSKIIKITKNLNNNNQLNKKINKKQKKKKN